MDRLDLLAVQGTFKSLLQHHKYVRINSQSGIIHFHSMQLLREEGKYLFAHGKIHLLFTHTEF